MVFFISSPEMLKLISFVALVFCFGLTIAGQEQEVKVLKLLTNSMLLQSLSQDLPVAIPVDHEQLSEISSSVLIAESWLRTNVLTHFPRTKITTILVANNVLCQNEQEESWDLVLPSVKNIYHSLVRWGLEKEIKVSPVFSAECLHPFSYTIRENLAQRVFKPLLTFVQSSNSTYSVNAPPKFSPLVSAYEECVKKLGFLRFGEVNVVDFGSEEWKPKTRKLYADPFPARPTPLPEPANSFGFSVPSHVAKNPLPPLPQTAPPPSNYFSFAPQAQSPHYVIPSNPPPLSPPYVNPSNPPPLSPPYVIPSNPPPSPEFSYPPCYPAPTPKPSPPALPTPSPGRGGGGRGLWCVAKPSVPEEDLQEAMDYACGVVAANCEEIKPYGSCYYPNTMVAHASFAFNSYWQRNKDNGGTCDFGGTAMVISTDPSYLHCRFIFS